MPGRSTMEAIFFANKIDEHLSQKNGAFTVKSYYEKLLNTEEVDFPHRVIWIPKIMRKACFSS